MTEIAVKLKPDEFDCILIALNWYVDDCEECASVEEHGLYDAGADESREAAERASMVLEKLRKFLVTA